MPIPVLIPPDALPVTDADTHLAEQWLQAFVRLVKNGSTGASLNTPASTVAGGPNSVIPVPVAIDTAEKQLFYRQQMLALAATLIKYADATAIGITRLSTDPANPLFPTALNAEEVSISPSPNRVPRALPSGLLDPAWITGSPGQTLTEHSFVGVCAAGDAVGDLMYISGASKSVSKADITDSLKIPSVGCIVSKSSATSCLVQTSGLVSGVYSGLTPGKLYMVGANSRPTLTLPSPGVGSSAFVQQIGISIDVDLLLLSPSSQLTKIRG